MIRTLEQKRNQIDDTIAKARLLKFTIGFPASVQKAMRTIDILKFYKEKDLEHAMHDSAKALSEMTEEERIQVETWIEVFTLLMVIAVQEEEYIGLRKVRDCVKTYNEACMGLVLKKSDNGFSEELEGYSEYERNMMAAIIGVSLAEEILSTQEGKEKLGFFTESGSTEFITKALMAYGDSICEEEESFTDLVNKCKEEWK